MRLPSRPKTWRTSLAAVVGLAGLAVSALNCSGDAASDGATPTTSATVADPAQAQTVSIETGALKGASVDVPANALPEGATLSLAEAASPTEFNAAVTGDNAPGSLALEVSFKDKSGKAIDPSVPVTITLPATGALALAPVTQDLAHLHALLRTAENALFFWTKDMFVAVDASAKIVKILTGKGGVYQLAYLAAVPANFVNAAEKGITPTKGGAGIDLSAYACTDGTTNRYSTLSANASFKAYLELYQKCVCTLAPESQAAGFDCKTTVEKGFATLMCLPDSAGTLDDAHWTKTFDAASAQLKQYCDGTKWTTPTAPGTDTAQSTGTDTAASSGGAFACHLTASGMCITYAGSAFAPGKATAKSSCEGGGGTFLETGACPTDDALGTCKTNAGAANELQQTYYPPQQLSSSQSACASGGGTWVAP